MKKRALSPQLFGFALALSVFIVQSCSPVVHTEFKKGSLLEERAEGKVVELESTIEIEVTSPLTVKVYERIKVADAISQVFEKLKLEVTKNRFTNDGNSHNDPWFNHMCGGSLTCTSTVVPNEHIVERRYENITYKKRAVTSGTVHALINGTYAQDLSIGPDNTASVSIEKYFDVLPKGQDVTVVYSFKSGTAQSVVAWSKVEKTARAALPAYRKRGAANNSSADYITAFRISDDPSDLKNAYKYAANETEKAEINKLAERFDRTRFEQAKNIGELGKFIKLYPNSRYLDQAKYLVHLDKDCNGSVVKISDMKRYLNKQKCVVIVATKFRTISGNSGLFKTFFTWAGDERDLFYVEFPTDYQGNEVRALAKIKGVYSYTTMLGRRITVPHLRFIVEIPED